MFNYNLILVALFLIFNNCTDAQVTLTPVIGFGSNPGNLNMYYHAPANITGKVPLVLALHGCGQNALVYATQTGWNKLADEHGFYVVYPEQNLINNADNCFNWFVNNDQQRGLGEPLSVKQMIDYMQTNYDIDSTRIFITGLSAGACMTNVMLASYPDVFNAGASMSGVPYKAATTIAQSDSVLLGEMIRTPQAWGDSVRTAYPTYTGSYPRMAIFQGTADVVSNEENSVQLMKQWTNLNVTTQTATSVTSAFNSNALVTQSIYTDTFGTPRVETYFINTMPHGIALDTGDCYQQGGETGPYALEVHLYSSFWAAYFWGITGNDGITITGPQTVVNNQSNVVYSVANTVGVTYTWTVPQGATITSGQGTNQITVNFGTYTGLVSVTELSQGACETGPANLDVNVVVPSAVEGLNSTGIHVHVFPNPANRKLNIELPGTTQNVWQVSISDVSGKTISSQQVSISGTTELDVTALPAGFYFLTGQCEGENWVQKFVKE